MKKEATSFRLKRDTRKLLAALAKKHFRSQANIIEVAVQQFAKKEGGL